MRLLASALCDHAVAGTDGKLELRGVFHDLYAPGFPARQEQMFLVLAVEWDRTDEGRYAFRIDVTGPGGRPTLTVEGESQVTTRPADRPPPRTRLVMPLEKVVFPVPGRYDFQVILKGRTLQGPTLYVMQTAEDDGPPTERE